MDTISSQKEAQSRTEIQTFVFFDLETSGLIQRSYMPKITEISLVATSRDSLFTKDGSLPRVMHKLIIPLQPMRPIPLVVSQITGLYNDLLELEKPFDDGVYNSLNSFINRLCPPVCFVAHNGNRFDYPILFSELNRIGKTLSEDILCVDSLKAFKTLLNNNDSTVDEISVPSKTVLENLDFLDDDCDAALAALVDTYSISSTSVQIENVDKTEEKYAQSMQKINETTPTHQINMALNISPCKRYEKKDRLAAKKRLPFTLGKPANLKLDTIYKHLVGVAPLNLHSAEADCISLLTCMIKIRDSFVSWADLNAIPLARYAKKHK